MVDIITLKVVRLFSSDGKFPCPNVTHIGQEIKVDVSTLCQYDVVNPLNHAEEKRVTIDFVDENGKANGKWTILEAFNVADIKR